MNKINITLGIFTFPYICTNTSSTSKNLLSNNIFLFSSFKNLENLIILTANCLDLSATVIPNNP